VNAGKDDVLQRTLEITDRRGVDVVIEAVGSPDAVRLCLETVRPGGRALLFGITTRKIDGFNAFPFYFKEIEAIGSRALVGDEFEPIIRLVASRRIRLSPLNMDRYTIDQLKNALDLHYKEPKSFKILVFP
jgi:threonine dehydrogenase-like Zn-dependent dehydrogenase